MKLQNLRLIVQFLSFTFFVVLVSGAFCTFTVGTIPLVEPLGFLQVIASSKLRIGITLALGGVLVILFVIFTRRFFCGWFCPIGFIIDLVDRFYKAPNPHSKKTKCKEVLAITVISASAVSGTPVWCTLCPVGAICRGIGLGGIFAPIETALLTTLALAPEFKSKRWFCRNLCPIAGVINMLSKISQRGLRITVDRDACVNCKLCSKVCPMGLELENYSTDDCILCLNCYEKCPKGAIKINF